MMVRWASWPRAGELVYKCVDKGHIISDREE